MIKLKQIIGIDARFYGPIGKGLGRYTQEIVDYLTANDQEHDYVIFLCRQNFDDFQADGVRVRKVLADARWYGLTEQFILPSLIIKHKIDLMHFPHFNAPIFCPVGFVVTIHDLILTKYPTVRATTLSPWLYGLKNLAYRLVIWQAIHRAKKIITVSEFTKQDIINNFRIKADKVVVTYEGVADLNKHETGAEDCLRKFKIVKPYLLYVGNAYPHKNLERLLYVAKDLIRRHDLQLVLVGKSDYFYQRLTDLVATWSDFDRQKIIFTGFVSDSQLETLYRLALAYVFPSLYEGFGLPPLEAMARQCPVVASDRSCLPEILGEAALYFNPEDNADMARQIDKIINNYQLRAELAVAGLARVKRYDWRKCGRETLVVYLSALAYA